MKGKFMTGRFSGLRIRGFTLIEVMIVVLILGMLAAIAYPNYSQYVVRANRSDGQDKLTEIMFEQERYQLRRRTYATDLTLLGYPVANNLLSNQSLYTISAAVCGGGVDLSNCVRLTATPIGRQAAANEVALQLDSRGGKTGPWQSN